MPDDIVEPSPKPNTYGVRLMTWGTEMSFDKSGHIQRKSGYGQLMSDYVANSRGMQHASVQITIPANEKGDELAQKCREHNIPVHKRTVKVSGVKRDSQGKVVKDKNGNPVQDPDNPAFEESAYVIHFSWRSSKKKKNIPSEEEQALQAMEKGVYGSTAATSEQDSWEQVAHDALEKTRKGKHEGFALVGQSVDGAVERRFDEFEYAERFSHIPNHVHQSQFNEFFSGQRPCCINSHEAVSYLA